MFVHASRLVHRARSFEDHTSLRTVSLTSGVGSRGDVPITHRSIHRGTAPTMDTSRVARAVDRARALANRPWEPVAPVGQPPGRAVLIGDPQTTLHGFLTVLEHHGLLGDDGALRPDISLVSVGDHFDHGTPEVSEARADGLAILRWLVAHPPDRVIVLLGNHDAARVTELYRMTDETFALARVLAHAAMEGDTTAAERFAEIAPDVPTPEVAWRDYGSYAVAQRSLVQQILMGRRMHLAWALALRDGSPVLVTHAGVTQREIRLLSLERPVSPRILAQSLNARLHAAVDRVAMAWSQGRCARLPLEPWHVVGHSGREGGGMLYHRPAVRTAPDDPRFGGPAPRRFTPDALPRGLVQAVGHTGHTRTRKELAVIATPAAQALARSGLRTLCTRGDGAVYDVGFVAPMPGEATMYLVDGEMHHVPVEDVPLLELLPTSVTTAPER